MFDLSLVELLFIAVVTILVVGPQDIPKVIRAVIQLFRQLQQAASEVRQSVDAMVDETGVKQMKSDMDYIIDQDGNYQQVFDIADIEDSSKRDKPQESGDD
ncbi:MAG: twin-arginine translocase TatA/TatE family subunit [Rickettsiales bacterium]|nr:twin-arginine translocase TatA/TatE family subunit [Rickettsiales bacterium]